MSGVTQQEEEKKPIDNGGYINLKVKGQVFFKMKRTTRLRKLMNVYCNIQSMYFNAIAFLFDGRPLKVEQTPTLEMEDGDEIDAMLHQTGGGSGVSLLSEGFGTL